jgi:hypothetical protein
MTFSIRTFLIVIALFACWLGALVSHVPLLVELVASATALLILLTLPLAIWDPRAEQRAYWTGFFVLALGNMLLTQYFNAYQQTGSAVATLILGAPQMQTPGYSPAPPTYFPPTNPGNTAPQSITPADAPPSLEREERFYQPAIDPYGWSNPSGSYIYQPVGNAYYQRHAAIRTAVPNLFSLLAGVIGGWLTQWIYRQKERAGTPVSASP